MAETDFFGDLQIKEDLEHERREWKVQRIAWILMALVLVAAVLGLFGDGLFSEGTASTPDGSFALDYPRLARFEAPTTLTARFAPPAADEESLSLWLEGSYLRDLEIERMTPEPESTMTEDGGVRFVYAARETSEPFEVTLHVRFERFGSVSGRVGTSSGAALSVRHFVYP
jgi:hypothetical protein